MNTRCVIELAGAGNLNAVFRGIITIVNIDNVLWEKMVLSVLVDSLTDCLRALNPLTLEK